MLPAEPEDDVPHGVHDAAPNTITLLLLLLRNAWNRKHSERPVLFWTATDKLDKYPTHRQFLFPEQQGR